MFPLTAVYGFAAPLRSISGTVAMSFSYSATFSEGIVFFLETGTVPPRQQEQIRDAGLEDTSFGGKQRPGVRAQKNLLLNASCRCCAVLIIWSNSASLRILS